jgi:hypothetical protein
MKSNYVDFYIVMEQSSPVDSKIEILENSNDNDLNFLRFTACLQSFDKERNRNRRKWVPKFVKEAIHLPEITELLHKANGLPGENGHPISPFKDSPTSMERIVTIDPNNISHLIKKMWFKDNDTMLMGEIETLDDGNGPGSRFKKNILQGMIPSFSNRAIIPQRKNVDGSIDQIGVGRIITFDRVILPSHDKAYMDVDIPVKNIIKTQADMVIANECCTYVMDSSSNAKNTIGDVDYAMESLNYDNKSGMISAKVDGGTMFVPVEENIRKEIGRYMMRL